MPSLGEGDKLGFEQDIKPLRTKERDSMMAAFDVFDYKDGARGREPQAAGRHSRHLRERAPRPVGRRRRLPPERRQDQQHLGRRRLGRDSL